jgi:hypothetical protein
LSDCSWEQREVGVKGGEERAERTFLDGFGLVGLALRLRGVDGSFLGHGVDARSDCDDLCVHLFKMQGEWEQVY